MKRSLFSGLAASALVASGLTAVPTPVSAAPQDLGRMSDYIKIATQDQSGKVIRNRWFVQVSGVAQADGATAAQVQKTQDAVVRAAAAQGVQLRQARHYSQTFNGMAVTMDAKQAARLETVPGVTGIYPVVAIDNPATKATPTDAYADSLSGAAIVRDDLGYTGKGIKVGIIDSGIDIDHPDLGGNGRNGSTPFPTKRVKYGYDFVGDNYNSNDPKSVPQPDPVPDDCGGHGTHVAGIIGANGDPAHGGVRGVAPDVTFGAYRVFGCTGSTSTEVILAALDRAEADHMDVVNMSLGASMETWPDYPTAQATDAMTRHGIVMVTAAGNDGTKGVFTGGAPSVGKDTISVASYDNTHVTQNALQVDGKLYGYGVADGAPRAPLSGDLKLVALAPSGTAAASGCDPITQKFEPGTAVLIERGTCSFRQKALNAQAAGASAVILYNNQAGTITPTVEGDPAVTIPVVMLSQADGQELAAKALAGSETVTWTNQTVSTASATAGQVSDFSSYGLAADLTLKPDLGAPGGNIWSTYPLEKGGYTSMSGTSMATPHVAGSVALLLQARPKLKGHPHEVLTLLQNTAVHDAPWSLNPKIGLPEPVIRQGAGLIQLDRAVSTEQTITPSKISLGDDASRAHTTTLTLHNTARRPVVYTLTNQTSIGTLGTSDPQFDLLDANVTMPTKVVVKAHSSAKVKVTITSPADAPNGYIYGGWIVATTPTGATLNVPYAGMAGHYSQVSVLTAPGSQAPCLGRLDVTDPANPTAVCLDDQSAGRSYSMADGDQPVAVFRVEYPAQRLTVKVYHANADGSKGALLGTIFDQKHLARQVGDVALPWDGTYNTPGKHSYVAKASAGSFLFEVSALRPTGNPRTEADWERWTSPAFTASFSAPAPAQGTGSGTLSVGGTTTQLVPANS